jgi:uncharacterized protein (TIGR02001 family)
MKKMKQLSSSLAVSALALSALAPVAQAQVEISAEVGASNMYYWRGFDLGGGAAVWGDVSASYNGFYAGVWTSSGDAVMGTEYDIYFGYATEIAGVSIDLGYVSYIYPEAADPVSPFDATEVVLGLGYGPVSLNYHHGMEDFEDAWYFRAGVDLGQFHIAYGLHDTDYAHIDLTYNYNDNISFTLGLVVDDVDGTENDEAKFIVNFSLPF